MSAVATATNGALKLEALPARIARKEAVIAVIGLGYVGLPVACEFARVGFCVVGVDLKRERVDKINRGENPIDGIEPGLSDLLKMVTQSGALRASDDYAVVADADVVTINVETPVDAHNVPHYAALRAACQALGRVLKPGALVIVESTVAPGTTYDVVKPILEETTGRKVNTPDGFYLGACPERVMPGRLLKNLRTIPRVCGGSTPEVALTMRELYRTVVNAEVDVTDVLTAEFVKTVENAYRDVQIAFANEVALICEQAGADVYKVRELVNKSPGRYMLMPGAGVGGHCIPKDPWLLAHAAGGKVPLRIIPAAREVNESMPFHMVDLLMDALREAGFPFDEGQPTVLVLGYAYLENSDDTRHSPSKALVARLRAMGVQVVVHDPWVAEYAGELEASAIGCDAAVVMVAHAAYRTLDLKRLTTLLTHRVLVDGRGVFDAEAAARAGLRYRSVGRGDGAINDGARDHADAQTDA